MRRARDRERRRVVDEQRQCTQLLAGAHDQRPVLLADVTAPQPVGLDPALAGEQPGGQLLGRHLEREHADDIVGVARLGRVRRDVLRRGGVGGDGDGQGRLAHARAAGEDDQIGGLQAAQLLVEAGELGRHARDLADLVPCALDVLDRLGQHDREGAELALGFAFLGEGEQLLLGQLDLLAAAFGLGGVEGAVDRVLADLDQPALEGEVVDDPAILGRR